MINLRDLTLLLLVHFLADAALQTNKQVIEKSTDEKQLFYHVLTYSSCMLLLGIFLYGDLRAVVFHVLQLTYLHNILIEYFK